MTTTIPHSELDLFDFVQPDPEPTITDRFAAFHAENPGVYLALVAEARKLRVRGFRKYGIGGLLEVVRWQHSLKTTGDEFKVNNNFRPYYARLIMHNCTDLEAFFETRKAEDFDPSGIPIPAQSRARMITDADGNPVMYI